MNKDTRRIALSGVMAALATAILMMGGVIPAATFVGPALAGVVLLPVLIEGGRRAALGTWVAVSALSLILCADKEAALLFAFMGWYPAAKWPLERKFPGRRSLSVKLVLWNLCAGAMAAVIFFVFPMEQVIAEYREMGRVMLIAFVILANVTLLLYDRLLGIMAGLYLTRLRGKLFRH